MRSANFWISARPNSSIVKEYVKSKGMVYHVLNKLRLNDELPDETVQEITERKYTEKEYYSCSNFIDSILKTKKRTK